MRLTTFIFCFLSASQLCFAEPLSMQQVGGSFEQTLMVEGPAANGLLGTSISGVGDINGDGVADFIAGAPGANPNGRMGAGMANVYSGATGLRVYRINGVDLFEMLGSSVAGVGDTNGDGVPDFLVGSPKKDLAGQYGVGAAYLYSGATGLLLHEFQGAAGGERFGTALSGAGDVDGDGFADVIISAPSAKPNGLVAAGSVFVYSGATGVQLHEFHGFSAGDYFGDAVSEVGDIDGDGQADFLIGASSASPNGMIGAGQVFLHSGASGAALMVMDGQAANAAFGSALDSAGDLNGDGVPDFIIGAPETSNGGSAFVFSGITGTLLFRFDGSRQDAGFGASVAGVGDVDGLPGRELLIGAPNDDLWLQFIYGEAFLFSGTTGQQLAVLSDATGTGSFATTVSATEDIDGDGLRDLLIGSPNTRRNYVPGKGEVYVYSFLPSLRASASSISAAMGGTVNLTVNFPSSAAPDDYKILISQSGMGPTFYGVDVPLTFDSLVHRTFLGIYPFAVHSGLQGILNNDGNATGAFSVAPGLPASLIGQTFWLAAIAHQPGQFAEYSSVAWSIEITP